MKAIINVNKNSSYAHLNGLTFEVKDVLSQVIALDINGVTIDFSHTEVMIVDFQAEMQKVYDNVILHKPDSGKLYNNLSVYRILNNIQFKPIYNCPA